MQRVLVRCFLPAGLLMMCSLLPDTRLPAAPLQTARNESSLQAVAGKAKTGTAATMAASVNGAVISTAEVEREINNLMMQYRDNVQPQQVDQFRQVVQEQALENLINRTLLLQIAEQENIDLSAAEIDTGVDKIVGRFSSPEQFEQQLSEQGLSRQDLKDRVAEDLIIEKLLEKNLDGPVVVTGEEIKSFYNENMDIFNSPEQVRASHILLRISPDESQQSRKQKRKKLADLRAQVQKGADFAQLVRENSQCPSKSSGGDLGFFPRGNMVKPFEESAFSLKAGEVSSIVETQLGFHLIKVTDRQEARALSVKEAQDDITVYLKQQKEQKAFVHYLKKLRQTARVEYSQGAH